MDAERQAAWERWVSDGTPSACYSSGPCCCYITEPVAFKAGYDAGRASLLPLLENLLPILERYTYNDDTGDAELFSAYEDLKQATEPQPQPSRASPPRS